MSAAVLARRLLPPLLGGFLLLALVGWVMGEAIETWAPSADWSLLGLLDGHRSTLQTAVATTLTTLGSGLVLLPVTLVVVVLLVRQRRPEDAFFMVVTVLGTVALLFLVKDLVGRARPPIPHLVATHTPSFPSAHSGDSLAFYGGLALVLGRRLPRPLGVVAWSVAVLLVAGVGWSRLYLGVHYPADVLGAYILASAWLVIVRIVFARPHRSGPAVSGARK